MKFIHEKEVWLLDLEPTRGIEIQIRCVDQGRFLRQLGELGTMAFKKLNKKTAEALKLLPQEANAHNADSS